MKVFFRWFLMTFLVFALVSPVFAETDVKDMQDQLDKLMRQMDEQKDQIDALKAKIKELQAKEVPQAAAAPAEVKTTSKYKINIYGKIKFDGIYDTNNMGRDEFITFIPRNADGNDKTTFNVRDTRFGVAIEGPSLNGWTARGRFESDFYGSDPSSNGGLRIRLAYIDFQKEGTSIRVGQDWNQIASLNPSTLDFAIMGYNGNLWNRVPQVTIKQQLGDGLEALLTAYRYRSSDEDDSFGGTTLDASLRMPWVGGKVAYSGKLIDPDKNAYIALDGAVRSGTVNRNDVTPYLAVIELKVPVSMVELMAEGYIGQGLGLEYFHQTGSFNTGGHAILTRGGFVQVTVKPMDPFTVNLGYGMDDPKDGDVGIGFYQRSKYSFGNVMVQVMKDISWGIEAAHVRTDWATGDKHGTRYQTSLIYTW